MKAEFWRAPMARWLVVGLGLLAVVVALAVVPRHNGPIAHPTGARNIVAQLSSGGGMVPRLESFMDAFPQATLYGDGTLIYHAQGGYHQARLDEAAMQQLLHQIVDDADFFGLPSSLAPVEVYDAPGTSVTLNADGRQHSVSAMALGFGDIAAHDPQRARLVQVVDALGALLDAQAPAYLPTTVRLYAEVAGPADPQASPIPPWPYPGIDLSAVIAVGAGSDGRGYHVTGDAAPAVLRAAAAPAPFTQGGQLYRVVAVPELP